MAMVVGCIWAIYPLVYYLVSARSRYCYAVFQLQVLLLCPRPDIAARRRRCGGGLKDCR